MNFLNRYLDSPLFIPSGIVDVCDIAEGRISFDGFGFFVTKTITAYPRGGNDGIRVYDCMCGMLNSIGLENEGVDEFVEVSLPKLKKWAGNYIVSISIFDLDEIDKFQKLFSNIDWAIELNLSCPNVSHGASGLISQDKELVRLWTSQVVKRVSFPVIVKLSPDVVDIGQIAQAALDGGASAITVANTIQGMAIDIEKMDFVFNRKVAGLSGPAIFPIILKKVYEARMAVDIPILGVGGVFDANSCLQMAMAGASCVGIGSFLFRDMDAGKKIFDNIRQFLGRKGLRWEDIVGVVSRT